ncbi:MAG TPA: thioredoxin family protein [Candidatus Polarisedimenticolia bacterium]|nr:thioredoxin family protein [Candidatus Polarisedimenticolia bacterium]
MRSRRLRFLAAAATLAALPWSPAVPSEPQHDPVLGRVRPAAILDIAPEWRRGHDDYHPDPSDIDVIRSAPDGSLVMVYFGSWCSDSVIAVPRFLKIIGAARDGHLKARYVGVDRTKKEPAGRLEGVGLQLVPTFVLSVRGREIGRIVETPVTTLEHDLALLVRKALTSPEP